MRISILGIGDELICGQVVDTNAGTIAAALLNEGLKVQCHLTVGDNEPAIMDSLSDLARVSDVIIVTGGLGPTADDMTSRAAARATGRRLVINEEARRHVRLISGKLETLLVCPLSDKQAMIPTKSTLIPNPNGTACGFHLIHNGCFMFFMPGVPSEMTVMLRESVVPFILERVTHRRVIRTAKINVFGPCEAEVDEILQGVARPDQKLSMGICVNFPWMQITLRVEADNDDDATDLLVPAARMVRERLKEYVFSAGDYSMYETVGELFREHGLTVSVAESCSGGLIAKYITDIPGSSEYFLEGLVTYGNDSKMRLLGVSSNLINTGGAVSSECASVMAKGVRLSSGSDLGLAVTGVAGPDGGSDDKPVGTVFISLAAPDGCWTKRFQFKGNRDEVRTITAWTALDWLRRYLLQRSAH